MHLHTDNTRLRPLEPEDIELLYLWENDSTLWKVSNTLSPFSHYVLKQYLEESHRDIFEAKQLRLIIEDNTGLAVGAIDLFDYDPNHRRAGVGILIYAEEQREKGYAGTAVKLLCKYAKDVLGMHQLYANIGSDNYKSLKLFEQCGFKKAGTKKEWLRTSEGWIDEILYQIIFD
ncbi:MAG: GNAT family N-acetyltransferase [Mangrovibacterium sp.]